MDVAVVTVVTVITMVVVIATEVTGKLVTVTVVRVK